MPFESYASLLTIASCWLLTGQVVKAALQPFAYGGFSDLWQGWWKGAVVACKVLKGPDDPGTKIRLQREARVWSSLHHPNITPFYGVSFDFDRPGRAVLVSQYCRHGDLQRYLARHAGVDKLLLITQVALAMSYLHKQGIVHGDLKSTNILMNDRLEASLTDFGLSRILEMSGFTTKTMSVTWRYAAPELLDNEEPRVTAATDVWAFAMTVLEIYTQCRPYAHIKSDASVVYAVMSGRRPRREDCQNIDPDIWQVLERCWARNPERRPSMTELSDFFVARTSAASQTQY